MPSTGQACRVRATRRPCHAVSRARFGACRCRPGMEQGAIKFSARFQRRTTPNERCRGCQGPTTLCLEDRRPVCPVRLYVLGRGDASTVKAVLILFSVPSVTTICAGCSAGGRAASGPSRHHGCRDGSRFSGRAPVLHGGGGGGEHGVGLAAPMMAQALCRTVIAHGSAGPDTARRRVPSAFPPRS